MYRVKIGSLYLLEENPIVVDGNDNGIYLGFTDLKNEALQFSEEEAQHNASAYGGIIEGVNE